MADNNTFGVIYADPPWQFRVWSEDTGTKRSAESHYRTMNIDDICQIPVADIAAPDSMLFLWVTWPVLKEAIRVGESWGFVYKTLAFDWLKVVPPGRYWHMGLGYYTRANSEPCLLFTRGTPKRKSKAVRQLIADTSELQPALFEMPLVAHLGAHSAKPLDAYRRIEQLAYGPYCELFARQRYPGWTCLGNEIDGLDICEAIRRVKEPKVQAEQITLFAEAGR